MDKFSKELEESEYMMSGSSVKKMCKSAGEKVMSALCVRHRRITLSVLTVFLVGSLVHLVGVVVFGGSCWSVLFSTFSFPDTEINLEILRPLTWLELTARHADVQWGQSDVPLDVAVIVPYRKRDQHLRVLLHVLHSFLPLQRLRYRIVVVELEAPAEFNRALLLNIGVVEARRQFHVSCFVLHDVDLVPLNARIQYRCAGNPKHLSVAIDKFDFKLPWPNLFGGACALTWEQLKSVNGMPNVYFGWGGEDDDFYRRLMSKGWKIEREPEKTARYTMLHHCSDENNPPNPNRYRLRQGAVKRMPKDGLSTLQYRVEKLELGQLFVLIRVRVDDNHRRLMLKAAFDEVP